MDGCKKIISVLFIFSLLNIGNSCTGTNKAGIPEINMTTSTEISTPETEPQEANCYLVIMGYEWMNLYITDPINRHLGFQTNLEDLIIEIPRAEYQINPSWGEEAARGDAVTDAESVDQHFVMLSIPKPVNGVYGIEINGTANTSFGILSVSAMCGNIVGPPRIVLFNISQHLPLTYEFTFSSQEEELLTALVKK